MMRDPQADERDRVELELAAARQRVADLSQSALAHPSMLAAAERHLAGVESEARSLGILPPDAYPSNVLFDTGPR